MGRAFHGVDGLADRRRTVARRTPVDQCPHRKVTGALGDVLMNRVVSETGERVCAGPDQRFDPETRDIIQTVYIRRVEKVAGKVVNVEFDKIENVRDPVKAAMKK